MNWWQKRSNAWLAAAAVVVAAVAAVLAGQKPAPSPEPPPITTTSTTTSSTSADTTTSTTSTVLAPANDLGAFSAPTSALTVSARSVDWAERLLTYGTVFPGTFGGIEFGLSAPSNNYGVPTYDAADATMRASVRKKGAGFNGYFNVGPYESIPWNPNWRPADGKDSFLHIVDRTTGQQWGLWNVSWWSFGTAYNSNFSCLQNGDNLPPIWIFGRNIGGVGYDSSSQLCAASAYTVKSPTGTLGGLDYTGNFPGASGGGWHVPAITPAEVAAGIIRHPLHLAIVNTMTGPQCTPSQRSDPAALGVVCGDAIAPAGQFEQAAKSRSPFELSHMVPEGMRFGITSTDAEINTWLDGRKYTGAKRETARVIAVALRDYGMLVGDTTAGGATLTAASAENPVDRRAWADLGIDNSAGDPKDLLYGLIQPSNTVAFDPAVNTCNGVESRFYCWSEQTRGR